MKPPTDAAKIKSNIKPPMNADEIKNKKQWTGAKRFSNGFDSILLLLKDSVDLAHFSR